MERTIDNCFYQIQNGANIKQGDKDGGFPITRIETIANDKFNRDRMGYAGITDLDKYRSYVLEDGDLLMSHINSVQYLGRTVLYEQEDNEIIIHGMNLLRLKAKRDIVNPAFARYCFYATPFRRQIANITKKSVNQASFAVADLKRVKLNIPGIDEQSAVVDKLDKVRRIIEIINEELRQLDYLIKARFVEMFGDPVDNPKDWEQVKLKDVSEGKLSYGSGASAIDYDGECRYIRITDITDAGDLTEEAKSPDSYDERYILNDGDILFARSGATVGKTLCYNKQKHGKALYAGYLIRMVPNTDKVLPSYVFYYTKTDYYSSFIENAQRTVAQPNINAQEYGDLIICVPPIGLQEQFQQFVEQVDKSKVAIQKSLDETQLLFDSLMQEYFG